MPYPVLFQTGGQILFLDASDRSAGAGDLDHGYLVLVGYIGQSAQLPPHW